MSRKRIALMLLFMFALIGAVPCYAEGNLLQNPGFEEINANQPGSWLQDVWDGQATKFYVQQEDVHSGKKAAVIESFQANDAKFVQKVKVEPGYTYKLSAFVKVISADPAQQGANVSVLGVTESSRDIRYGDGTWQQVVLYGKTGEKQKEIQIAVRLGGYGNLTTGKVFFDDIVLEEVKSAPADAKVISFEPKENAPAKTGPEYVSAMSTAAYAILFYLFFLYVYHRWFRREPGLGGRTDRTAAVFVGALVAAFILRLYIAQRVPGYEADINTFKAWADKAARLGFSGFYDGQFADYPPGYIYVLWLLGKIVHLFDLSWTDNTVLTLIKLPAILADLAIAGLLYRVGAKRLGAGIGLGTALLFLFNPAVIVNSAGWGQVDSFFTLFLILVLLLLAADKWEWSAVLFAVAVLIKPQALIFTPALLYPVIRRGSWRRFAISAALALGTFILLILPFSVHKSSLWWIVDLYRATLASYPYASLNAFNLYTLLGGNFKPAEDTFFLLPYQTWGNIFIVLAVGLTAYLYFRRKDAAPAKSFYTALLLIVMVFMLAAKMHERYLFPALALMLFTYIFSKDRRFLHLFAAFSVTHYLNVHHALKNSYIGQPWVPDLDSILIAVSFVQLLLFAWLVQLGYDLWVRDRLIPLDPEKELEAVPPNPEAAGLLHSPETGADSRKLTRHDWVSMGAVMLIYAVVAFVNLGSTKAPETPWKPSGGGSVILDLGAVKPLDRVNVFSEIGDGKVRVEFSDTPGIWQKPVTVELGYTKVFYWNVQKLENVKARYVKVSAENAGFTLNELAMYEPNRTEPVKPVSIQEDDSKPAAKGKAANLFDEQDTAVATPTFMDRTYFDEIYHARTAYEHIHLMKPYENTHPPLGKLLIAVGIKLFGMNPFGWRIVGTVIGILMIPLTYLFAKRLFGRSEYGLLAAFLMAVDFMHFAQTRIATIDSYGVFFIMLMYYFMYRYYSLSFYTVPLRKTLIPLFLSGLFFGIGAASKWIVIYGGAGLALIFFLSLYERYRQWHTAGRLLELEETKHDKALETRLRHVREVFVRNAAKTVAWCSLFFVIIPVIIYSLSFVPYMQVPGEKYSAENLVKYQEDMWNYHSKLKATHGFASPWYEWPFIIRPIWYYTPQVDLPKDQVSTISSFGNPGIWWAGLAAFAASLWLMRKQRHRGMFVVAVAFFSQYLPWILVTRLTFIYHYFAMVPFLIFSIVYLCKYLIERNPSYRKAVWAYAALCLILFVMFYPVLSGMTVPKWYVSTFLKWLPTWVFYS